MSRGSPVTGRAYARDPIGNQLGFLVVSRQPNPFWRYRS